MLGTQSHLGSPQLDLLCRGHLDESSENGPQHHAHRVQWSLHPFAGGRRDIVTPYGEKSAYR